MVISRFIATTGLSDFCPGQTGLTGFPAWARRWTLTSTSADLLP